MRRWLATIPWIAAMSLQPGCEYYRCKWGTWPMDGATGVALDAAVEFTSDEPLPELLPEDMTAAFTLRVDHGDGVPFDVEVDGLTLRLVPREPLRQGVTYVASGMDVQALRDADHHWWGQTAFDTKRVKFQTGGLPTLRQAIATPQGRVIAVFSEPMDLETLGAAFELVNFLGITAPTGGTTSTTSTPYGYYGGYTYGTPLTLTEPVPLEVVGHYLDEPFLVELNAGEYASYLGNYPLALSVDPRGASVRGPLLDRISAQVPIVSMPMGNLQARWKGRPTCSF
jgi:hypothetical protein